MGGIRVMKLSELLKNYLIIKSREDYKKAILSLVEEDRNACLLDLGCGDTRRLTDKIVGKVHPKETHGVDLHWLDPIKDNLRVYQADLNGTLPTGSNYFDIIIASQVIEHLWNTDGFLKEIHRCLKPTGYAIISTPNLAAWHNRLYLLLGKQPPPCKVSEDMYPEHERPGHLRVFTEEELIKLLRFHGFKVDKVVKTFGNVTVKMYRRPQ